MLCFKNLKLSVSERVLVPSISVTLFPGSITYVTGKNGAGKTTLLQTIAGLKDIKSGNITLHKLKINDFVKPYCLLAGHNNGLEKEMRVIDQLEFWAKCYNSEPMIPAAIQFWDLGDVLDRKITELSEGNAKKVSLSRLTCCHADLWLLDEVETNLDENNLKFLHYAISSKASSGGIVIITSHQSNRIKGSQELKLEDFCV